MAKIAQASAKYIIHSTINVEGVVDRPDVIGAIFGQTEGLLGSELELRELQKSGKIGRIEVNLKAKNGKTDGEIIIPSSLDKAETSIVGAAMEIIERIGPCLALIKVVKIEDIRISKRDHLVARAKELLKEMITGTIPDSQELAEEVSSSVRVMEITSYGKEKLPAGPSVEESDEIIIVEGRADVITLLKNGFKNGIAMNGSNVPLTLIELCKKKTVTVFVDGDRGGDLNIQELLQVAEIDFITKAPDGKEVEELTQKEIHKALRGVITVEQFKLDMQKKRPDNRNNDRRLKQRDQRDTKRVERTEVRTDKPYEKPRMISDTIKAKFKSMLDDLVGTRGAYVLDAELNILGKVPVTELQSTIKSLRNGIYAVLMDGDADQDLADAADNSGVKFLVASDKKAKKSRCTILTGAEL